MENIDQRIEMLEKKIDELQRTLNSIKKIVLWTVIASVVLFILPLIGLMFVVPQFLSSYSSLLQ